VPGLADGITYATPRCGRNPRRKHARLLSWPRREIWAPCGAVNVAIGKPVSTSSDPELLLGFPSQVTDGHRGNSFYEWVELCPGLQYVQIDLASSHRIYAILVWHGCNASGQDVHDDVIVQVADDRSFTRGVRTLFNNDHDNSAGFGVGADPAYFETAWGLFVEARGVPGRYVRVYSNDTLSDVPNHFAEVEVYGVPGR